MEWILTKSTHSPVLLSPVVIEQCRLLLLDSWVRSLFNLAIDDDILDTDAVMQKKTEKDLKYEKEMMGGENAMALAAKEATHERGEGILWQSSKWAKKLGKTMVCISITKFHESFRFSQEVYSLCFTKNTLSFERIIFLLEITVVKIVLMDFPRDRGN